MINKGHTIQIMKILNDALELMVSQNVTPSKFEFNLGFAKVSRSIKKIKK